MRSYWGTAVRLFCVLVVVLSAVGSPAVATAAGVDDASVPVHATLDSQSPVAQQSTPTPAPNNSSDVIHENPDEVDDENELNRLLSYLSGRMNDRIGTSSVKLSQGEYEAAKSALGDSYSTSLSKYVDVAGETDEGGSSEQYESAQQTQREYIDTVQEFRETRQEYQEAKQEGNDERARELARELTQLSNEGDTQSNQLVTSFDAISNDTGSDLSESRTQIQSVQTNISEQQAEIAAVEFTPTQLEALSYDREISFTDPLVVSGTLKTANNTPVNTSLATFSIGSQTIQVPVESDGSFTLTYRPTRVPANASELTLQYQPSNTSVYQTTSRTLTVSITQVEATAQVDQPSESTYGYADSLAVQSNVSVNGTPVEGLPLVASLERTRLSGGQTTAAGTLTLNGSVPASVPAGDASLRVSVDRTDRAVAFEPVKKTVNIASEQTVLDTTARQADGQTVVIEGQLTTVEGEPVHNQPISVRLENESRESVMTNETGFYRTTVELPADVDPANATITVAFDGAETNLKSVSTTTGIQGTTGGESTDGLPFTVGDLLYAVAGSGLVGLVAVVLLRRRRNQTDRLDVDASSATSSSADEAKSEKAAHSSPTPAAMLTSASDLLSAGEPSDAVVVAYTGVRHSLASVMDVADSTTHWEFYEHCAAADITDTDALEQLTAGYEKAAYSGRSVSESEADELVETAASLIDD